MSAPESGFVVDPGVHFVLTGAPRPDQREQLKAAASREALLQAVHTLVSHGARLESQSAYSAIVRKKRWFGGYKRLLVSLDAWGYAHVHKI